MYRYCSRINMNFWIFTQGNDVQDLTDVMVFEGSLDGHCVEEVLDVIFVDVFLVEFDFLDRDELLGIWVKRVLSFEVIALGIK